MPRFIKQLRHLAKNMNPILLMLLHVTMLTNVLVNGVSQYSKQGIESTAASREGAGIRVTAHGKQVPEAPAKPG